MLALMVSNDIVCTTDFQINLLGTFINFRYFFRVARSYWWPHPPDWKRTNIIKTHLEPLMIDLLPISKLLSFTTIQRFLKNIILSWVNWLRNGESSNFNEAKKVPQISLKLVWSLPWQICFHFYDRSPLSEAIFVPNQIFFLLGPGRDMSKGPGTEEIMFLSAFILEIWSKKQWWLIIQPILTYFFKTYNCPLCFYGSTQCIHIFRDS